MVGSVAISSSSVRSLSLRTPSRRIASTARRHCSFLLFCARSQDRILLITGTLWRPPRSGGENRGLGRSPARGAVKRPSGRTASCKPGPDDHGQRGGGQPPCPPC